MEELLEQHVPMVGGSGDKTRLIEKDLTMDTSFLPGQQRDEESRKERKRLELDWKEQQDRIQKEALEITYNYWDDLGHQRITVVIKSSAIDNSLEQVCEDLCGKFKELSAVALDALLYVKEDLIVPQDLTFYDLIVTKAPGKLGPFFFLMFMKICGWVLWPVGYNDKLHPGKKDTSHPGKVVKRRWYERNKHTFPASQWELYDPATTYGNYSIHEGEVNKKEEKWKETMK
jgi:protein FAM50